MMAEAWLMIREEQCAAFYSTTETTAAESGNMDCGDDMMESDYKENQEETDHVDSKLRCAITHKRLGEQNSTIMRVLQN